MLPWNLAGRRGRVIIAEILIIVALVLVNGFFAGAEVAVIALRRTRLQELVEEGRRGARAALALREDPERFLATTQVGITLVGMTAAAFSAETLTAELAPELARHGWVGRQAAAMTLVVVVAGLSYISIVLGELVPKSLALRNAERYALLVAWPLLLISRAAAPVVWLLGASANLILRPFGDSTTFTETRHSAEELQELLEEATRAGTIHPEAGEIASRALELPQLRAADVMVPRQDVVMIARNATPEDLRRILLEHTHSRMPVYDDRIDNVIGYISVKDLLAMAWDRQLVVLADLIRPPYFVPRSKRAVELLQEMRQQHTPFAIVLDEQGGMSGIVTMEDLVEELVGEIFSEHVRDVPEGMREEPDGALVLCGTTPIREVNRALHVELAEDAAFTTVAGLCLSVAGRIPAVGALLDAGQGITLEVIEASARRVQTVRVRAPRRSAVPPA